VPIFFQLVICDRRLGPTWVAKNVRRSDAEEKILGMFWQPAVDDFKFNVKFHKVLSLIMSTFNPLGFLCCFLITAKLLLREIWRREVKWDEPLPDVISDAFEKWRQERANVDKFRCTRYYFGPGVIGDTQLHIFVDASQSAFAIVAYWRVASEDDVNCV